MGCAPRTSATCRACHPALARAVAHHRGFGAARLRGDFAQSASARVSRGIDPHVSPRTGASCCPCAQSASSHRSARARMAQCLQRSRAGRRTAVPHIATRRTASRRTQTHLPLSAMPPRSPSCTSVPARRGLPHLLPDPCQRTLRPPVSFCRRPGTGRREFLGPTRAFSVVTGRAGGASSPSAFSP